MINRAAVILRYREPAARWVNEADPNADTADVTLGVVNNEATVYLVSDEDADGPDALDSWIELNYQQLFESELDSWYTDPELWPQDRTLELFRAWFEIDCHTTIVDTVGGEIYEDEQ